MSKRETIARYNLIINKLRKAPASFKTMSDYLLRESELQDYDFNISSRTFQRDVADILALYHIDIQFDYSRGVYYIESDSQPDINNRMLEAFDTYHALHVANGLAPYIHFEKRKPQGTEHLYGLLHAIKNKLCIRFSYQKFWEEAVSHRTAEPYAMKEFKNRWYVLAKDAKDGNIKSFALDRLTDLEITGKKFKVAETYNVEESYRYCFGIISPNGQEPQEIVLQFDPVQGKYIKSLPLHETQQVILDNEDELQVKLKLCITHDFIMELLSFGSDVKALQPASLCDELKEMHQRAFAQYNM